MTAKGEIIRNEADFTDMGGCLCTALLCQQYWYCGQLSENFNVIFLETDGAQWHRLFIDAGEVFWKFVDAPDSYQTRPEDQYHYPLVEISESSGLLGKVIYRLEVRREGAKTSLILTFAEGNHLFLHNEFDKNLLSFD